MENQIARLVKSLRRKKQTQSELATALKITEATARHWLQRAVDLGIVHVHARHFSGAKGRPSKIFAVGKTPTVERTKQANKKAR